MPASSGRTPGERRSPRGSGPRRRQCRARVVSLLPAIDLRAPPVLDEVRSPPTERPETPIKRPSEEGARREQAPVPSPDRCRDRTPKKLALWASQVKAGERKMSIATDGCRVTWNRTCKHGHPSWLVHLGYLRRTSCRATTRAELTVSRVATLSRKRWARTVPRRRASRRRPRRSSRPTPPSPEFHIAVAIRRDRHGRRRHRRAAGVGLARLVGTVW